MNERNGNLTRINRREAFKFGLGALAFAGTAGAIELGKRLGNQVPEMSCEDTPVPTGHTMFDVYGNKTDSNELLNDGYAVAVQQEKCRQEAK